MVCSEVLLGTAKTRWTISDCFQPWPAFQMFVRADEVKRAKLFPAAGHPFVGSSKPRALWKRT
jgi:hypothetical protein